jgi:mono/diheme cytochrome c family protein
VASCAQGAEIIEGETGFYDTPYILLPTHSAPLDMLYYRGAAFPQLNGQLIVSLHGYRETGHRIIAFAVDDKGLPQLLPADQTAVYYADNPQSGTAALEKPYQPDGALLRSAQHSEIVSGWYESAGYRPLGSPLGLLVDAAGLLWVVEDKPQSKAILVIAPADAVPLTAAPRPQNQAYVAAQTLALRFDPQNWQRYQKVYDEVLMTSCAGCHGFDPASPEATPLKTFARLLETPGWIKPGLSGQSVMLQRIAGNNTAVMPPSSSGNPPVAAELLSGVLQPWIDAMPGSLAQSPVKIATTAVSIRSAAAPAAEKCGTLAVGDLIYVTGETTGADYHWYEYKLPDNSTLAVSCRNRSSYFSVQRKIGDKTYITDLTD